MSGEDVELPDIRVVTVSVDASDGYLSDLRVDANGTGYYEAVGLLVCALWHVLTNVDGNDDESDDEDDE